LPDGAIAVLLWHFWRREPAKALVGLLAWVFSPLVLYTAYFHGQYDLIPVFFVALSLFCAHRERPLWAAFWLGIGACYKNFPFAFLLPLALILDKTWRGRLKLILAGTVPYILFLLPNLQSYAKIGGHFEGYFFKASYDLGSGAGLFLLSLPRWFAVVSLQCRTQL
jgi:Gpi18-like mannosyltransferase